MYFLSKQIILVHITIVEVTEPLCFSNIIFQFLTKSEKYFSQKTKIYKVTIATTRSLSYLLGHESQKVIAPTPMESMRS